MAYGDWGEWLGNTALPLAKRVLVGLGFGYVTYEGLGTALDAALGSAKTLVGTLGVDILAVLNLGGFLEAFAVMSGGLTAVIGLMLVKRLELKTGN